MIGAYEANTRCYEWPLCTGHAGPTPEQQRAERAAAAERVRVKRAIRRQYPGVTIR